MNRIILSLKRIGSGIKKILPGFVYRFFTKLASAFLTPIHFSIKTGHFKSSWKKQSFSSNGNPIPWYSYSLIDFLKNRNFSDKRVLEWGGGNSSFWWAARCKEIITLEGNKDWFEQLNNNNQFENLNIQFVDTEKGGISFENLDQIVQPLRKEKFDIIIIDGMDRGKLVHPSIQLLKENGIIIIDDSERYDFNEVFDENKFYRIDFFGYAPGILLPKCSSIHFREMSDIFSNKAELEMEHVKRKVQIKKPSITIINE